MIIRTRAAVALLAALGVSLALNFTAAGYLATTWTRAPVHNGPMEAFGGMMRAFPPEMRAALRKAAGADRGEIGAAIGAMKAARQETFAAMRADPLDVDRVSHGFMVEREKAEALITRGQQTVIDVLKTLPADVRARIGAGRRDDAPFPPPEDGPPPPDEGREPAGQPPRP